MPATPAWPPKSLPRLFVRAALEEGARVELDAGQANYLGNVMRLGEGAEVLLFDGSSGEWLARIAEAGKKRMALSVERRTREPEDDSGRLARLCSGQADADGLAGRKGHGARRREAHPGDDAAHDRRAGEAGAAGSDRDRSGRAMRTDAPAGDRGAGAARAISRSGTDRTLYFADEARRRARRHRHSSRARRSILTGPEGGFTDEERAADPRRRRTPCRSRSGRASCAPRRPRSRRWPPTWRLRATGADGLIRAINRKCWRGLERAAKRRCE